jgi:hypothetical protein
VSNEDWQDFNAKDKAALLMQRLDDQASHYVTDDLFVLFGGDFQFKDAEINYRNMDAMIEYMNKHHSDKYNFIYSTPSNYVDAVAKRDIKWPTKYDDMFPYSDSPDSYWTGYFTSRPNHKSYIRSASHNFHASNQLYSVKALDQSISPSDLSDMMDANY